VFEFYPAGVYYATGDPEVPSSNPSGTGFKFTGEQDSGEWLDLIIEYYRVSETMTIQRMWRWMESETQLPPVARKNILDTTDPKWQTPLGGSGNIENIVN